MTQREKGGADYGLRGLCVTSSVLSVELNIMRSYLPTHGRKMNGSGRERERVCVCQSETDVQTERGEKERERKREGGRERKTETD